MGVFLVAFALSAAWLCLPHVRGGVSPRQCEAPPRRWSSPRAWGCFLPADEEPHQLPVFPTCVGVFLLVSRAFSIASGLPHVRGGVSDSLFIFSGLRTSSPRAWGCFRKGKKRRPPCRVFPTCVGVFPAGTPSDTELKCLPHVRGGVSEHAPRLQRPRMSSPRAWGCFRRRPYGASNSPVFPTCVGVFPRIACSVFIGSRLSHGRGGGSFHTSFSAPLTMSSPRAWGCFRRPRARKWPLGVFPTCVGVFPTGRTISRYCRRLPHVRGGVSKKSLKSC